VSPKVSACCKLRAQIAKVERESTEILSSSSVLFTLAKQAKFLQANKLCLLINKRLQSLKPPAGVQEQIDVSDVKTLIIQMICL